MTLEKPHRPQATLVTWRAALPLSGLPAAYSDLVQLGTTLGALYETGDFGANERIAFQRIAIQQLR